MEPKSSLDLKVFFRLLKSATPYRVLFSAALITTIFYAAVSSTRPLFIGELVKNFVGEGYDSSALLKWTLFLIILLFAEAILQFLSSYLSSVLGQRIIRDIRQRLFNHLVGFRRKFFDKTPIGSLVTRVVSDIEAMADVFSQGVLSIIGDVFMLFGVLGLMLATNWKLTLVMLIPFPLLFMATKIFARAMKNSFMLERQEVNRLNTFVQERITGMSIVQLFNRQEREAERFRQINERHREAHIKAIWANSIFFPVVDLLSSLSIGLLFVWSVLQIEWFGSDADVFSEVVRFTLWINMLFRPVRMLADKFNTLQRGVVRAERVFELLDRNEFVQDTGKVQTCDFNQKIKFENVWFAYEDETSMIQLSQTPMKLHHASSIRPMKNKLFTDEKWVLKNLNMEIEPGETIAIVGSTGSGKTSIINLLGRFYEYQKGKISIGNIDLRDLTVACLRSNIGIVLQDVFLFSDTIHNNITLGNKDITREQVIKAAKEVGAHDFISKLKEGYDYQVGERGGGLSVGQRQLISFIRAYVYNPSILILDEATSNIDNESEALIQLATEKLTANRTSIVIAHRLTTISKANKIFVLEKGSIIESGSHEELLALNGTYKKLFELQYSKL
jgi:ATP-binding cassette subfamily B protein